MPALQRLLRRLAVQRRLLNAAPPRTVVWYALAVLRQRTLEDALAFLPRQREAHGVDPRSVICIF